MPEPNTAPRHLVARVVAVMPPPGPDPFGTPVEVQQQRVWAQAQLIADLIWGHAWTEGAVFQQSIEPARMYLCEGCPQLPNIQAALPSRPPRATEPNPVANGVRRRYCGRSHG